MQKKVARIIIGLAIFIFSQVSAQQVISTVAELERLAPMGGEYRLAAGRYVLSKPLVLTKALTLTGAGKESTTVLGSSQYYLFSIESSEKFKLEGIGFVYFGLGGSVVVDIKDAEFEIIDCSFSGGVYSAENDLFYGSGLYLHGDAKGIIKDSYFRNNRQDAIHLESNAQASLSNSLIEDNIGAIAAFEDTSITIVDSTITDNGNEDSIAVYAEGDSRVNIRDSKIEKNLFGAFWILGNAELVAENNTIHSSGSEYSAITTEGNASSQIIGNDFSDNFAGAIWLKANSTSTINNNIFTRNGSENLGSIVVEGESVAELNENLFSRDWGLWFAENSKVTATKNEILYSPSEQYAALTITDEAEVDFNNNKISKSNNWAVYATDNSRVVLLQNTINENMKGAFVNSSSAPLRLIANIITKNTGYGAYLIAGSNTYAAANTFEANSSGLVITEKATANVFENKFKNNTKSGIAYLGESRGKVVSNRISANAWNGIVVGGSASVLLEHNQIIENALRGILISENAFAKINKNMIEGSKVGIFVTTEAKAETKDNSFNNNETNTFKGPLPDDEN